MYRYDQPSPGLSISQTDLSLKRSQHFEDEESASFSWHSADKKRKSNYIDAYTSSCYSKTDFGDKDDKYPQWMINNLNMTKVLKEYRQITENGTQMGKHLSDIRILVHGRRCVDSMSQEGEANQIIELLRLFLIHCWTSRLTGVKYEWLTYHLLPTRLHSSSESMIPDYVLFSEPYSSITFDLCFVETM
ncbi:hypothetical protein RO3G_09818 [Rhizopus delemar RA 99-880]|uniref:Uncharacterized protein n=1 Tax=Rhizopus delemar (strain RA 99-880 / ATCC MYA-4621 / FGSC 9543 / NRRL 43880) TaxID=246409 RepID=I1C9H8_RHIO9|nr:hypothetical protein RO3G_09818 [Rhizopus delemar RA 99-880]|eukprot:EIE85108.1 hypothetical protein RO3G_09818 [Rhizopus delemar RA 99-880]